MKVVITPQALASLQSIVDFMVDVQQIPKPIVKRYHAGILEKVEGLVAFPYQGAFESTSEDTPPRRVIYQHVRIIYRVVGDERLLR